MLAADVAAIVLALEVILVGLLRGQAIRTFAKFTDSKKQRNSIRYRKRELGELLADDLVVEIYITKSERVSRPRTGHVSPDYMNVRPVEILKRRLPASSRCYIPTMIEAVESVNRAGCVPVHPAGSVTDSHREAYVTCHLREEGVRRCIVVERLRRVEELPVYNPEGFCFDERPAGTEPDLMPMERRIARVLAILVQSPRLI